MFKTRFSKRSIFASFLFFIITLLYIISFILGCFNNDDKKNYLLNKEKFRNQIYNKLNVHFNKNYEEYLNNYIYYLFYNRSYPNININIINKKELLVINKFINIKFSNVLLIRKVYKVLHIRVLKFIINCLLITFVFIFYKICLKKRLGIYRIITMIFIVNYLFLLICGFGYKFIDISDNIYFIILNSVFDYTKVYSILSINLRYLITTGFLLFIRELNKYYKRFIK